MSTTTTSTITHIYGLSDDLLIYIFNFLRIKDIVKIKQTSKYLNKFILDHNECYHYLHMSSLETMYNNISNDEIKYKLMESFNSIKSLETVININRLFPVSKLRDSEEYKNSKLLEELPSKLFYDDYVTKFLSKLKKLESLIVNGCFDDIAKKLPYQSRLQSMTIRNTESSGLLTSFFNRLLSTQFNLPSSDNNDNNDNNNNDNKHDSNNIINSWIKIFNKVGVYTLCHLSLHNFVISMKTLFYLSKFENLTCLHIQYDQINYKNVLSNILNDDNDLKDSFNILKSKVSMICYKDDDEKWNLEPMIALLFKNICHLKDFSISGQETATTFENNHNTLTLLILYWSLYFQSKNLQSLSITLALDPKLKYYSDYDQMQIYNHIMKHSFKFNIKQFNSLSLILTNLTNNTDNNDDNNDNNDNSIIDMDIDDVIIKYGTENKQSEYISNFPLSLQMFISLFDCFKNGLNEYYYLNKDKIETKHHIYHLNIIFESIDNGYYIGYMIAKAIFIYHPKFITLTPSLLQLDQKDSNLFINCIQSMCKWCLLFATKTKQKNKLKLINTLKINISCISSLTVKQLSEFIVSESGIDNRLINSFKILNHDLSVKNIKLSIETMIHSTDRDKLRYYMKIQKQVKQANGFKIDLITKENSQVLVIETK